MSGAAGSPAGFRLATFNVETLGEDRHATGSADLEERVQLLRPQLVRLAADILCLQEIDSQRAAGHGSPGPRILHALDALIADTPYAGFHRLATHSRSSGQPRDKHNLVVLSRWPFAAGRQVLHELVAPLAWPSPSASACGAPGDDPGDSERQRSEGAVAIAWDRPFLYTAIPLPGYRRPLHLINVHLKAPRAAWIAGGKLDAATWRSMAGWAEGFFLAAVKRAGQALEVRLLVDRLFDADGTALIAVCGDFNADVTEVPVRTIRGDEEDAGNPHLALRTLVPLERSLAQSQRFSVVHHGRPQMLDHVLVSRPLMAGYRSIEVHNEALGDELVTAKRVAGSPESFHAPVVAEFRFIDSMLAPGPDA